MKKLTKWPYILDSERTPLVDQLLEILNERDEYIGELETEIKRLNRLSIKPTFNKNKKPHEKKPLEPGEKRPGSAKEQKTQSLQIHHTHILKVEEKPANAVFKGYRTYTVQEIAINVVNHLYKCERWQKEDGSYIQARLPEAIAGHHFGPMLRAYILHQYYHQGVTQGLLQQQLKEWAIKISKGQLNRLLIENKAPFHDDKKAIYDAGMFVSSYLQVDDTGARHQGKNGYCTYIGNEYFAYFQSTLSKSRVNFLACLQGLAEPAYLLDNDALLYLLKQNASSEVRYLIRELCRTCPEYFFKEEHFLKKLNRLGIKRTIDIKLCKEAALYSHLLKTSFYKKKSIISDEAGQFCLPDILHGLCWLHAERKLKQVLAVTPNQEALINQKREAFWYLYNKINEYKLNPDDKDKKILRKMFNELCEPVENYEMLNEALSRIRRWQDKLLLVLDHPDLPIHNNTSERDIRDYVRRRKISGGTRSDIGRQARDTFTSIKKTCQKVNVSFWSYLLDKINRTKNVKKISDYVIKKRALENVNQFF